MERSIFSMISYSRSFSVANGVVKTLSTWQDRVRERRHLANLEPHLMKDIGLEPWQVRAEAAKPFWQI
jgi:uncharacterized protein YjiS (DUF1127 family)